MSKKVEKSVTMFEMQYRLIFIVTAFFIVLITIGADAFKNVDTLKKSSAESENKVVSFIRNKRDFNFGVPVPEKPVVSLSKIYQACKAPGDKPGHCTSIFGCSDDSQFGDNPYMMNQMCIMNGEYVGVCCADEFLKSSPHVSSLAGPLPAIAAEADDALIFPGNRFGTYTYPGSRASCGISPKNQVYESGSRPTNTRDWPWVAALLKYEASLEDFDKFSWQQFCGGTLITDQHIITAAHCLVHKQAKDIRVRLGEYNLESSNETRALDFEVAEIITHENYNLARLHNDISVLKLKKPTIFNTYIWPVCLPPPGSKFEDKQATILGWGTQEFGGAPSKVLMEVSVPVWRISDCIPQHIQPIKITNICAGAKVGLGDACQQDSGGPLLHQTASGRWVIIGIVSWGVGCGYENRPGVYTRVNTYLNWFTHNVKF